MSCPDPRANPTNLSNCQENIENDDKHNRTSANVYKYILGVRGGKDVVNFSVPLSLQIPDEGRPQCSGVRAQGRKLGRQLAPPSPLPRPPRSVLCGERASSAHGVLLHLFSWKGWSNCLGAIFKYLNKCPLIPSLGSRVGAEGEGVFCAAVPPGLPALPRTGDTVVRTGS